MADFFQPRDLPARARLGKREHLTVTNAVKQLTPAAYQFAETGTLSGTFTKPIKRAVAAVIQVQAQPLNFTIDGTDPTATTVGFKAIAQDTIYLNSIMEIQNFKAIRNGATDAELEIQYLFGY